MAAAGPGFFQMGEHTPKVSMQMHAENRGRVVDKLLSMYPDVPKNSFFLLYSGDQTTFHDTDNEPLYRPESNFNYAFGVHEPDFYGAVHIGTKKSILFMPRLSEDYAIWMGKLEEPAHFKSKYAVDEVYYSDEIERVLSAASAETVLVLHGFNSDGKKHTTPATFQGIEKFNVDKNMLHPALTETRVFKSALEIQLMRELNKISSDAHRAVMQKTRPGVREWQMEAEFLYNIYAKGGCRFVSIRVSAARDITACAAHGRRCSNERVPFSFSFSVFFR